MANENDTEVEDPKVKTASPPADGSQADGSPSHDDKRPTGDETGTETEGAGDDDGARKGPSPEEQNLELRRRLTEMGEDKKQLLSYVQRIHGDPKIGPAARAILEGRSPEEDSAEVAEEKELLTVLAGEGNESKLTRLLELREKRLKGEVVSTFRPTAQKVAIGHQSQVLADALEGAELNPKTARTPAFKAFQRTYEAENSSWYGKAREADPDAMAELLVRSYEVAQKRTASDGRDPAEARSASLNHGGGGGAKSGTGKDMEFDPYASDSFQQIQNIYKKGGTPVAKRTR